MLRLASSKTPLAQVHPPCVPYSPSTSASASNSQTRSTPCSRRPCYLIALFFFLISHAHTSFNSYSRLHLAMLPLSVPPPSPPCPASTPPPLVRTLAQSTTGNDGTQQNWSTRDLDQDKDRVHPKIMLCSNRENILSDPHHSPGNTFMHPNRGVGPRCHWWWPRWLRRCHQGCSARSQGTHASVFSSCFVKVESKRD